MPQVLVIHGGTSFSSYDAYLAFLKSKEPNYEKLTNPIRWKEDLARQLPEFDVLYPTMPNSANAVYDEWCIVFQKLLALLDSDAQLVGHSLGAMFLAKYFATNQSKVRYGRLLLVAGGYNDESVEDLGSFRVETAKGLENTAREVHLFHSQDDPVVPFTELQKYQRDLPLATTHVFSNRGHFVDETFPEIIELLKKPLD